MNDTQQESRLPNDVPSMLLAVEGKQLLLPGVAVAEIIHYATPSPVPDTPAWFLGTIEWRTLAIPLLSFELMNGQDQTGKYRHIIVLNNTGTDDALPFLAIPIQGIPRLVRVTAKEIEPDPESATGPMEKAAVRLAGDTVFVPDVANMERACLACWQAVPTA